MRVVKDLFYIRLPVAGKGAYGWGPFETQQKAQDALSVLVNMPGPHMQIGVPRVVKESREMDSIDVKNIQFHDGKFSGGGRKVV